MINELHDFIIRQSIGYKKYINEFLNTSPVDWCENGKRKFTDKENNYQRIYETQLIRKINKRELQYKTQI
ncbi:hypothetical protein K6T82_23785 [Flavobacterium sp. 17A]|uniref:Uncharacterized protein n=1 Tax=Flavobacterium potami TaxID=2872310 RepID=A0A9X1HEE7_9FLAO|nr:hypothetical protein [Flavobacterium potami]MBZ4037799.1 hypothetical protein [Flavobacterium potami]